MRPRELLTLGNSGHAGMNALFAKAHSADWDIERDVDWTTPIAADAADVLSGNRVLQLLKSARRAGLLKPEILEALHLREHPLVAVALRQSGDATE